MNTYNYVMMGVGENYFFMKEVRNEEGRVIDSFFLEKGQWVDLPLRVWKLALFKLFKKITYLELPNESAARQLSDISEKGKMRFDIVDAEEFMKGNT